MLKTKCAEYHTIATDKQKPGQQTEGWLRVSPAFWARCADAHYEMKEVS